MVNCAERIRQLTLVVTIDRSNPMVPSAIRSHGIGNGDCQTLENVQHRTKTISAKFDREGLQRFALLKRDCCRIMSFAMDFHAVSPLQSKTVPPMDHHDSHYEEDEIGQSDRQYRRPRAIHSAQKRLFQDS